MIKTEIIVSMSKMHKDEEKGFKTEQGYSILQKTINDWLQVHPRMKMIDIKYAVAPYMQGIAFYQIFWSAMIIYDDGL